MKRWTVQDSQAENLHKMPSLLINGYNLTMYQIFTGSAERTGISGIRRNLKSFGDLSGAHLIKIEQDKCSSDVI